MAHALGGFGDGPHVLSPLLVECWAGSLLGAGRGYGALNASKVGTLPHIHGDPNFIRSAITNLLSNAVKYTRGRDPAVIEVGSERRDTEIIILVRDNGAGFDMEFVEKLFGVFQRLHRAQEFEGTGIGLASVRRVIQRHGGRTWAEGEVGRGATFYFSLPSSRVVEGKETKLS